MPVGGVYFGAPDQFSPETCGDCGNQIRLTEEWHGAGDGQILVDASIHGEYTSNAPLWKWMADYAQKKGLGMHVHVSETQTEHQGSLDRNGKTPIQTLDQYGVWDTRAIAAHCVWTTPEDWAVMAAKGISCVHNPVSNLKLGSGTFIPGFEDQLIGAKIGDEKDVNVTFPEEYHAEELKGKPAVFKCTVKSIKRKVLPALDDEFAKKASTFQTLDELKADIRSNLEKTAESKAESEKREEAIKQATENATVEVPEVMVEHRINVMIQELAMRLEQQGMKLEMYLQYAGTDINKLRETYRDTAAANVKTDLVLEAVAKAEGIKVETEELDAEVEAMAKAYGATAAEVKKIITQQGRTPDLIETVLKRKTAQFIIDNIAE